LTSFKVLVCGGRDFVDYEFLAKTLCTIHKVRPITLLVHGAARGADSLAGEWADSRQIPVIEYPADWDRYGKRAGRIRNAFMLKDAKPHFVLAMPGGKGTAHMVRIARKARVRVLAFDWNYNPISFVKEKIPEPAFDW